MTDDSSQIINQHLNYQWAISLIDHFVLQGVHHAVISPGSRSTLLALACSQHPKIKTWIQVDERCAAFFALGLAQAKHQPIILICTSGSALTHWLPAIVEANHSYTPLLLLSADRPKELQNCGANQTIDQSFIFGKQVRYFIALEHVSESLLNKHYLFDITSQAYSYLCTSKPGPVHINIPFREPLFSPHENAPQLNQSIQHITRDIINQQQHLSSSPLLNGIASIDAQGSAQQLKELSQLINSGNGLIICGRLNQQEQKDFIDLLPLLASKLNCPVLVDPLSNFRLCKQEHSNHSYLLFNYDYFLKAESNQLKLQPQWILRFGQFPVSKNLMQYLSTTPSKNILISSYGDTLDPLHNTHQLIHSSAQSICAYLLDEAIEENTDNWLQQWQQLEQQSALIIDHQLQVNKQIFEGHVIDSVLQHINDNSFIFSGNSMAIRDFDTFISQQNTTNKNIDFYANRGTSGIDGNISTFFGLLAQHNVPATLLLGDLSFYHDMNGLLIAQQLQALGYQATIIVINNNGGGIFNYLPQHQLKEFSQLWQTPIDLDFKHCAQLYHLNYEKIETLAQLDPILGKVYKQPGINLVEVIIDQQTSVKYHQKLHIL